MDAKEVSLDLKADKEIKDVFSLAVAQPDRSLAEIIQEYRRQRLLEKGAASG